MAKSKQKQSGAVADFPAFESEGREDARALLRQEPPPPPEHDAPKPVAGYSNKERIELLEYAVATRLGVDLLALRAERAAKEG